MAHNAPGCYLTEKGRYRALVVTKGKLYFDHNTWETPDEAIDWAKAAIPKAQFIDWHAHAIL